MAVRPERRPVELYDRVLGINQLHGHGLVQDGAEALEEAVHRPDPVALEGAPDLAYVAMLVGRVGHLPSSMIAVFQLR